jgi:hypothetical protein
MEQIECFPSGEILRATPGPTPSNASGLPPARAYRAAATAAAIAPADVPPMPETDTLAQFDDCLRMPVTPPFITKSQFFSGCIVIIVVLRAALVCSNTFNPFVDREFGSLRYQLLRPAVRRILTV